MKAMLEFPNNWTAARAVREFAEASSAQVPPLTLVPYGFMDPDFAPWWLVPGPHPTLPAYRHGKLEFYRPKHGTGAGAAFVGFYVEKAFPPAVGKALGLAQSEIMDDGWCWHAVIASARERALDPIVATVAAATELPVIIDVSVGEVNAPPKSETEMRRGDSVSFQAVGSQGTLQLEEAARGVLEPLNTCESVAALAEALSGGLDLRFYWVNLRIGVRLHYLSPGGSGWDAGEVWNRAMAPWLPWLK